MKPHRKAAPAEAAAAGRQEMPRCAPKADSGLSSAQAQALAEAGWDNRPVESPTKSDKQIIRENIFTYFNLIFVVLAVCLLLVGDWKDMTFLLIVAANAVIGIVQQLRSKRTIEKLSLLSAAKVRIIETSSGAYYGAGYQDVQNRVPKIENTQRDLDWAPRTTMADALRYIFDAYRNQVLAAQSLMD